MFLPKTYILYVGLLLQASAIAQNDLPDEDESVRILSTIDDPEGVSYYRIYNPLSRLDSSSVFNFISRIDRIGKTANSYFKARLASIKCTFKLKFHQYQDKSELINLNNVTINEAYETGNDHFIAFICYKIGSNSVDLQEMEQAATYLLKGQELYNGFDPPVEQHTANWIILGEVLFHCHEYEKSIFYTRKAISTYIDTSEHNYLARFHNTIGQDYDRLGKWDSALLYYEKSMQVVKGPTAEAWKGINAGYIGELYFKRKEYAKAKALLEYNYGINKTREVDHAARSLQLLAAIDLARQKNDSALVKIREALDLIKKAGIGYYLQPLSFLEQIYFTASDVYRALEYTDSFYVYNNLYTNLHDSLQQVSLLISTRMARLRIDNDNNLRGIEFLRQEKQNAAIKRNYIILSLLLGVVILLLYLNKVRLKQQYKQQIALQQKQSAEAELRTAREQMRQFTENIIEKTALIDKLNLQLLNKEQNTEHQHLINEITHQTILTEDDWEKFKSVFEKINPGFFINLKERARDITVAEQRMAALTRLNLTAKQMASILGISVDSVHKCRQRLRQRLHLPVDINLEESMASI